MLVGIAGGDANYLKIVDDTLEELIENSGVYIFTIFDAQIKGSIHTDPTLAHLYSQLRGLPCRTKQYNTFDALVRGICKEVDYLIILNNNSQQIKRLFMSYKQTGKHGSVINI